MPATLCFSPVKSLEESSLLVPPAQPASASATTRAVVRAAQRMRRASLAVDRVLARDWCRESEVRLQPAAELTIHDAYDRAVPGPDPPGVDLRALPAELAALEREITGCRRCPRLVAWREQVAREKRAAFRDETYWGRPVAGLRRPGGAHPDPRARAGGPRRQPHRPRLHRRSLGRLPVRRAAPRRARVTADVGTHADDGLTLQRRMDGRRRALRAAGQQADTGRARRLPAVDRARAGAAHAVRVILCLGALAWDAALRLRVARRRGATPRPRPRFGHGAVARPPSGPALLGCFHPSQQNTFTGRLTTAMIDEVVTTARAMALD